MLDCYFWRLMYFIYPCSRYTLSRGNVVLPKPSLPLPKLLKQRKQLVEVEIMFSFQAASVVLVSSCV